MNQLDGLLNKYASLPDEDVDGTMALKVFMEHYAQEEQPLVSVGMTAYNHEKTIAKALNSVLLQETDFPYEIVIADDESSDKTREIILHYAQQYPSIIKPLFYKHNVGMKNNYSNLRRACKGKYRCTLEGDDYWITVSRLKKQVDFLEKNQDYVGVAAKWYTVNEKNSITKAPFPYTYFQEEGVFSINESQQWLLPGHTSTMMYRNVFLNYSEEELREFEAVKVVGDRKTALFLTLHGPIYCFNNYIAARRILSGDKGTSYLETTRRQNMYYVMYHWTELLEQYAFTKFGVKLDYSDARIGFWINAFKHFCLLPCAMHYRAMHNIYKAAADKKVYRKAIIDKWKSFKQAHEEELLKALFVRFAKVPKRMYLFGKKRRAGGKSQIGLEKFI